MSEKKNNKTLFIVILVVVSLLVAELIGYLLYSKVIAKDPTSIPTPSQEEVKKDEKEETK